MTRRDTASEKGSVIFIMIAAVAALGLLIMAVVQMNRQPTISTAVQTMEDEITRMMTQSSALGAAVAQMVINGEDPAELYSNLSFLKPGDVGYDTPPHKFKLYHPYGGGIGYMENTGGTSPVIDNMGISPRSVVTGVGPTDAGSGDILFVARVGTAAYCQRINEMVRGSSSVPELRAVSFNMLFVALDITETVTLGAANCAPSCANIARLCVKNDSAAAWGYYAVLLPQ